MPDMAEPEVKVTMALIRLTHGYHTAECTATYDELQAMTGLSRGGVASGVAATNARGFIVKIGRSKWRSTVYQIDQKTNQNSLPDRPKQSTSQTKNSLPGRPTTGGTLKKEKERKGKRNPPTPQPTDGRPNHPQFTIPAPLKGQDFEDSWIAWYKHRHEIGSLLTQTAGDKQLDRLAKWGKDRAIAAINHSIAQSWKNIYEPKEDGRTDPAGPTTTGDMVRAAIASMEVH